jgi:hypothetical protein
VSRFSAGSVFRGTAALVALGLLALAALPALLPGTADLPLVRSVGAFAGEDAGAVALVAAGVLAGLAALLALLPSSTPDDGPFETLRERPPEAVTAAVWNRAGGEFDAALGRASGRGGSSMDDIRSRLRSTATECQAAAAGIGEAAARERVESGDWTENPTARAFLASGSDVTPSLTSQVRLWLDPPTERRRRIRVTVEEIAALLEGER